MKTIAEVPEVLPAETCWNCDRLICECGGMLRTAFLALGECLGVAAILVGGWLFWMNVKAWLA